MAFLLEDDTGRLLVDPSGAEGSVAEETITVGPSESIEELVPAFDDGRTAAQGSNRTDPDEPAVGDVDERRRYREERIEPGDSVLVYGPVERDPSTKSGDRNVVVRKTAGEGPFYVTDDSEQGAIARNYTVWAGRAAWSLFYFGLSLALLVVAVAVATS